MPYHCRERCLWLLWSKSWRVPGSGQGAKGSASIVKRPAVQSVRERWLPVTGVAIGVLSVAAILLSAGLVVLRLRRA